MAFDARAIISSSYKTEWRNLSFGFLSSSPVDRHSWTLVGNAHEMFRFTGLLLTPSTPTRTNKGRASTSKTEWGDDELEWKENLIAFLIHSAAKSKQDINTKDGPALTCSGVHWMKMTLKCSHDNLLHATSMTNNVAHVNITLIMTIIGTFLWQPCDFLMMILDHFECKLYPNGHLANARPLINSSRPLLWHWCPLSQDRNKGQLLPVSHQILGFYFCFARKDRNNQFGCN